MATRMSKEEYFKLYYYLTDREYRFTKERGDLPQEGALGRKRYDNINDARKGALAKSNRIYDENKKASMWGFRQENVSVMVWKGDRFLGNVTTTKMFPLYKKFCAGIWNTAENPKDDIPIKADGTICAKPNAPTVKVIPTPYSNVIRSKR